MLRLVLICAALCLGPLAAQPGAPPPPVLAAYIDSALTANRALQQQDLALAQHLAALNAARGLFLPSLTLEARYSRAGGGRTIDVPVGTLVNPVYATLNQLLQENRFPRIDDEEIPFLRETEHDTRLRMVQPLFRAEIWYQYAVAKNRRAARAAEREAFIHALVEDVQRAWYTWLKTRAVEDLLDATRRLLEENLRVSERLAANQMVTRADVYRARAELSALEQERAAAHRDRDLAAAYFNFLLNRPLDAPIDTVAADALPLPGVEPVADTARVFSQRPELAQLDAGQRAAGAAAGLARGAFLPSLTAVVDYGFQGEKYRFGAEDDYWMASLVLSWNLFNGFQDRHRVQEARLRERELAARLDELKAQIALDIRRGAQNLLVARKRLAAARDGLAAARSSFTIVERQYREGLAPQVAFLDARNTLTSAEINAIIAEYDLHIRQAEWERILGNTPVETNR